MDALVVVLYVALAASLFLGGIPHLAPPWTVLFALSATVLARLWRTERLQGRDPLESRPTDLLFWLCLVLYLASFRWHGGDDIPNSMLPYAILKRGTFSLDPFRAWATAPNMHDLVITVRGRLLSAYPVAPAILALPLYFLPVLGGVAPTDIFLHNLAKIAGALITASSVAVFYRVARRRASPGWAMQCALLYGLGTYAYSVSSQALYSHGPAQLGVALGLLGLLSESGGGLLAGFGFALAWASREDSALFGLAAFLYLLIHRRERLLAFLAGAAPVIAANLQYWFHFTGSLRPPYYAIQSHMFSRPSWEAYAAMLFSPERGLFFYMPAAALCLWGAIRACRDPRARWAPYMAAACAATWIFFGMRSSWTGGESFGNRYFSVVCLVLALFAAELEPVMTRSKRARGAWAILLAASVLIHALGANFKWPAALWTLEKQQDLLWSWRTHPVPYLFLDHGPIGATPMPWRVPYALVILLSIFPLAFWLRRRADAAGPVSGPY